ncbi:MAG: DUF5698 domain-containing protein [Bacillota bacterium]
MSLDVIRILMLTRGKKLLAALIGSAEVSIFILALGQVIVGGLDDPWKVVAYAGGFATGNFVGSIIEEKMAIGYLSLQIFPAAGCLPVFLNKFREAGFGVTCVTGQGRSGERTILFVLLKRKDLSRAVNLLNEIDPETFFNVSDARQIHGGIFPGKKKGK